MSNKKLYVFASACLFAAATVGYKLIELKKVQDKQIKKKNKKKTLLINADGVSNLDFNNVARLVHMAQEKNIINDNANIIIFPGDIDTKRILHCILHWSLKNDRPFNHFFNKMDTLKGSIEIIGYEESEMIIIQPKNKSKEYCKTLPTLPLSQALNHNNAVNIINSRKELEAIVQVLRDEKIIKNCVLLLENNDDKLKLNALIKYVFDKSTGSANAYIVNRYHLQIMINPSILKSNRIKLYPLGLAANYSSVSQSVQNINNAIVVNSKVQAILDSIKESVV